MQIVRRSHELVGKTIAFLHVAQFTDKITLVTNDGCVMVTETLVDEDTDEIQTTILNEVYTLKHIESSEYLRTELGKLGVFDIEAYRRKKEEERLRKNQEYAAKKEQEERELYKKLKAKYEPVN